MRVVVCGTREMMKNEVVPAIEELCCGMGGMDLFKRCLDSDGGLLWGVCRIAGMVIRFPTRLFVGRLIVLKPTRTLRQLIQIRVNSRDVSLRVSCASMSEQLPYKSPVLRREVEARVAGGDVPP